MRDGGMEEGLDGYELDEGDPHQAVQRYKY